MTFPKSKKYCAIIGSILLLSLFVYFFLGRATSLSNYGVIPVTPVPAFNEENTIIPTSAPQLITKKVFGTSTKGKDIYGYEIGSGGKTLLLFGAIHGDEKNTADLLHKFVEEIRANPENISDSKKLVVIPIVNPDGYYERSDNLNINGVNLNRNFATKEWKPYEQDGISAGSQPFSEIESVIIAQVVEQYQPEVMIAFHSQGALVSPEEDDTSIALAKWYGSKTGYSYYDEWSYVGTATLWFLETVQKPAITVELSDHIQNDWEINKNALLTLASSDNFLFEKW